MVVAIRHTHSESNGIGYTLIPWKKPDKYGTFHPGNIILFILLPVF